MDALIEKVQAASKIPSRDREEHIKPFVAELASLAYNDGVSPAQLDVLVRLVTTVPTCLDQASTGAIVRNLYPTSSISDGNVLRVIGSLGHGELKPKLAIQVLLLKWLIMVYGILDSHAVLSRAYSVFFNLLDTAAIRPQLCHLLALITRRKHVKPFRIQSLLELSRNTAGDPSLMGLLRVYKDYYPEIIVGEAVRGRASAFKHPDAQWKVRLAEIRDVYAEKTQDAAGNVQNGFRVVRNVGRQKSSFVPGVRTTQATKKSITLEEIDNVNAFVAKMDQIELPNQLVAILADPLLQKLLLLRPDEESAVRIGNWLSAVFEDVAHGNVDASVVADMLEPVADYVAKSKHIPSVVLEFLRKYLPGWNGRDGRESIVKIIACVPLCKFDELYQHIFQPMEGGILDNTPASQLLILDFYTRILSHWASILYSPSTTTAEHTPTSVRALVEHVNQLALTMIQTSCTVQSQAALLTFYELASSLFADPTLHKAVRIVPPPSYLIYMFLFSDSVATLSRLCGVLATYKRGFETAMSPAQSSSPNDAPYDRRFVGRFNGYLMDMCNCLWRGRAFGDSDPNASGCTLSRDVVRRLTTYVAGLEPAAELPALFGVSYSPVLSRLAILALRAQEETEIDARRRRGDARAVARHAGPVTQRSLVRLSEAGGVRATWQEYRIGVLEALQRQGLRGVPELMRNTMKVLMNSSQASRA